mmetsp:Transcript_130613/g.418794  ORF Transcript_130613/g.418794 Transcript_130613/m.418794 type:complete len:243 (-) Transcript_130613:238-966(-)
MQRQSQGPPGSKNKRCLATSGQPSKVAIERKVNIDRLNVPKYSCVCSSEELCPTSFVQTKPHAKPSTSKMPAKHANARKVWRAPRIKFKSARNRSRRTISTNLAIRMALATDATSMSRFVLKQMMKVVVSKTFATNKATSKKTPDAAEKSRTSGAESQDQLAEEQQQERDVGDQVDDDGGVDDVPGRVRVRVVQARAQKGDVKKGRAAEEHQGLLGVDPISCGPPSPAQRQTEPRLLLWIIL